MRTISVISIDFTNVFRSTLMIIQDKSSENILFRHSRIITFFDNSLPFFAHLRHFLPHGVG